MTVLSSLCMTHLCNSSLSDLSDLHVASNIELSNERDAVQTSDQTGSWTIYDVNDDSVLTIREQNTQLCAL